MPDQKAALEWAKNNPKDPRAQDIQAKVWAQSNPDDPRSDQILAHLSSKTGQIPAPSAEQPQGNAFQVANNQSMDAKNAQEQDQKQADFAATLHNIATKAVGTGAGLIAGVAKGATLGNVDFPHILGLDRDENTELGTKMGTIEGTVGVGSLLGASLPAAGSALGRVASAVGQGALMGGAQAPSSPTDSRLNGAIHGAEVGGVLGGAGEGIQALLGGAGRAAGTAGKALQMSRGDPSLQAEARGMAGQVNRPDIESKLAATKVQINPTQYMGHTPEVDQLIRNEIANKSPNGVIPSSLEISGDTLNNIKGHLEDSLPWKAQDYASLNPSQIMSGNKMLDAVKNANQSLKAVSPDEALLSQIANKPLTTLTSRNLDTKANINSLSPDLGDYASQLRSAKKVSTHPLTGSLQLAKQGVVGATKSLAGSDTGLANSPTGLSALLSLVK